MSDVAGTVMAVNSRVAKTKFGDKNTFSIVVDNVEYPLGFKNFGLKPGMAVSFSLKTGWRGRQEVDTDTLTTGSPGSTPGSATTIQKSTAATYQPSGGGKVFPIPLMHGDRSIIRQNALAHATKLVVEDSSAGTLEERAELIIRVARMFEEYSAGDIERRAAEELMDQTNVKD